MHEMMIESELRKTKMSESYVRKMRRVAREWLKYPSIEKMYKTITGKRRLGSEATVEYYINGVRRFVKFLGLKDPEEALATIRNNGIDVQETVDKFIDWLLERYAHKSARGFTWGVRRWLKINNVSVDWKQIVMPKASEIVEIDGARTDFDGFETTFALEL